MPTKTATRATVDHKLQRWEYKIPTVEVFMPSPLRDAIMQVGHSAARLATNREKELQRSADEQI